MPEGDSIHRLATRLAPVLVGREVRSFRAHTIPDATADAIVGQRITLVEARGKNLLIHFEAHDVLHIHLRMLGRVEIDRPRSAFYRPRRTDPQLRLAVDGTAVVGDRIPVLRLLRASQLPNAHGLSDLGPDLLAAEVDIDAIRTRLRAFGPRAIGDALLVQRALAGIGNVYKSEILFLEQVDPRVSVDQLSDETLAGIICRARDLLRKNLGTGPRTTRSNLGSSRYWVYRRAGLACFRCGQVVERFMQGPSPGRSTYCCGVCQTRIT